MTTKIKIENDVTSNGDVVVHAVNPCGGEKLTRLFPGETYEQWITTNTALFVTEEWPTQKPKPAPEPEAAIDPAKELGA